MGEPGKDVPMTAPRVVQIHRRPRAKIRFKTTILHSICIPFKDHPPGAWKLQSV
jgi:hypothetical protein